MFGWFWYGHDWANVAEVWFWSHSRDADWPIVEFFSWLAFLWSNPLSNRRPMIEGIHQSCDALWFLRMGMARNLSYASVCNYTQPTYHLYRCDIVVHFKCAENTSPRHEMKLGAPRQDGPHDPHAGTSNFVAPSFFPKLRWHWWGQQISPGFPVHFGTKMSYSYDELKMMGVLTFERWPLDVQIIQMSKQSRCRLDISKTPGYLGKPWRDGASQVKIPLVSQPTWRQMTTSYWMKSGGVFGWMSLNVHAEKNQTHHVHTHKSYRFIPPPCRNHMI